MPEIRCANKKFGEVNSEAKGIFEATCNAGYCRRDSNAIVLHRWNLEKVNEDGTITPIETKRFKRPEVRGI